MSKLDDIAWTEQELEAIHTIANWYGNIVERRGLEAPDHVLRAVLDIAMEGYIASKQYDELAAGQAQIDEDTVASLTVEPATAEELAAVCGVLASTLAANSGIVNEDDMLHHRARMVAMTLAQVRLRNQTEHLGSRYVQ